MRSPPRSLLPLVAALALAPVASGCDVALALIVSPFFPGKPLPPPDDLVCPTSLAAASEEAPLPASFTPDPPAELAGCDVGTKTLHRLNRFELDNTLRDLTGQDLQLAATSFPVDDFGGGFDNNADVLSMSPLLAEKLETAAQTVIDTAMARPGEVPETHQYEAEYGVGDGGRGSDSSTDYTLNRGNQVSVQAILPNAAGVYAVRVRVGRNGGKDDQIELDVDGREVFRSSVTGSVDDKQLLEVRASLDKGPVHTLSASFPPSSTVKGGGGGQLLVDFFEVEGPLTVTELGPDPAARRAIVTCDLDRGLPCVRSVIAGFARRAWRRPLDDGEVDRLQHFYVRELRDEGDVEGALRSTLVAVLLSPHFLFRVELDPDVGAPAPEAHPLSDHELAVRLSYFLWSSTPDARLEELADEGALQDPDVLEEEARRMLDDPKSEALVKSFAGQWLFTRAVASAAPDPIRFPQFDESLRSAMQCETELTFDRFLRDDSLSALDMVTDDETFVNDRLASHYGLEPPVDTLGHGWGLVSTQGTGRAGILTNASILTVSSQPTRTSPTRRGKWILENLLCLAPDPPPPGVEGLPEPQQGNEEDTVRQRLEQHRSDPFCASCHAVIDPFGFGLEHFDAIGRWRATDAGFAIDDSAFYMGDPNAPFHGARELAQHIHDDGQLPYCMTQKAMSYALGRGVNDFDFLCNVDDINAKFAAGGYKMSDLIIDIVKSPAFRMRRAEAAGDEPGVTP